MWQYRNRTIRTGKAWTDDNGVQHPANWHVWSAAEKTAVGLVEVINETPPDSRLYNWSQNSDGTITSTAKNLDDVNEVDENGDAIRTKATEMETAIDSAADTDAMAALFVTYTEEDDGSITKSGILYDWPELGN